MKQNNDSTIKRENAGIHISVIDKELYAWVMSLPWGVFTSLATEAIRAHMSGDKSYKLKFYDLPLKQLEEAYNSEKTIHCKKALSYNGSNDDVFDFLDSLGSKNNSKELKRILEKYLPFDEINAVLNPSDKTQSEPAKVGYFAANTAKNYASEQKEDEYNDYGDYGDDSMEFEMEDQELKQNESVEQKDIAQTDKNKPKLSAGLRAGLEQSRIMNGN